MLRRVVISVVALSVVLVAAFFVIPFLQARSLGAQLAADVTTLRQTEWPRNPPVPNPRHSNGYECFAAVLKVAPRDLSPFNVNGPVNAPELAAWLRTDDPEPLTTLPPELAERMQSLSRWIEELRECGNSRSLKLVPRLEPWDLPPRYVESVMVLSRYTALEVRKLISNGNADSALSRCNSTLAFTIDQSHQGILGAVAASTSLRMLAPRCVEAWNQLPAEVRAATGSQWVTLATRYASTKEVLQTERLNSAIAVFEPYFPREGVPHSPTVQPPAVSWFSRFTLRRLWASWDMRMRDMAEVGDSPKERAEASERLDGVNDSWFLPPEFGGSANYEKLNARVDSGRLILSTLQWVAAGAKDAPPPGMTRVEGAVEWKDADGKAHRISLLP